MALGAAWLVCAQVEKRVFEAARCVVSSVNLDFRRSGQWEVGGGRAIAKKNDADRKSTRLNSSHSGESRMPSSA